MGPDAEPTARTHHGIRTALVLAASGGIALALARRLAAGEAGRKPAQSGSTAGALPEGDHQVVTTHDGARLAVLVAGPVDGPTAVLPHCWTGSRRIWGAVAAKLVDDGHRVVLYDQRGHGESTTGADGPSIEALGDDLRAVLEAVDARDAVLAGHSMGGMTIQSFAARHPQDFVQRTRGVVLVATAARVLGRAVPAALVERALGEGRAEWTRRGRVGRAVVRGSLGRHARPADVDLTLECFAATPGAARAGFLAAMATMDLREGLADIGVPTTVMVGTRDRLTPPRLARQLAAAIPGAQLEVLPGFGHMLPLEAPERVADAIRAHSTAELVSELTR